MDKEEIQDTLEELEDNVHWATEDVRYYKNRLADAKEDVKNVAERLCQAKDELQLFKKQHNIK